ncbi:30S ribosome-binding factor RbfA [Buchnera aphidicola (Muscaphis stroyani)]|uniref:Ribosome-binding factor A n=1 Tax=Buchnera aphidicola (Muscaphis stroyani) TaxID=1241869 RepID=A0A4D6YIZ1_9GAMM|nr:30S ribosome-binding factor RbfA [Buchnera aphidicola]QCI24435.1 30S ribosome-binding factor RbfA [Buchnera aphidicola (Muscaphis stroyani)]
MDKSFSRASRIASEIQKKIALIIHHSLKDPRFKIVITVSEVQVSKDLSNAKIFISFLDYHKKENSKKILIILNKASGYIRKLLCKEMRLRIVPNIVFYHDSSSIQGNKISMILNNLIKNNDI